MRVDEFITAFDRGLRTLCGGSRQERNTPGAHVAESDMSEVEKRHAAGLMRVNHSGEVCAQALYQGQALTCRTLEVKKALEYAAREEEDHLAWTQQRLNQLGSRASFLNPFWYAGSFSLGVLAGILGDPWNLGFLEETEKQVEAHLSKHLDRLPSQDGRSRAILEQMRADEIHHAETARKLGGKPLPLTVQKGMAAFSRVMTTLSYRI